MVDIGLNPAGITNVMKSSEMLRAVQAVGEEVANNVRAQTIRVEGIPGDIALPVIVDAEIGDEARASVILAHPSGIAVQAKHGALTKAAAAAGLEVRGD